MILFAIMLIGLCLLIRWCYSEVFKDLSGFNDPMQNKASTYDKCFDRPFTSVNIIKKDSHGEKFYTSPCGKYALITLKLDGIKEFKSCKCKGEFIHLDDLNKSLTIYNYNIGRMPFCWLEDTANGNTYALYGDENGNGIWRTNLEKLTPYKFGITLSNSNILEIIPSPGSKYITVLSHFRTSDGRHICFDVYVFKVSFANNDIILDEAYRQYDIICLNLSWHDPETLVIKMKCSYNYVIKKYHIEMNSDERLKHNTEKNSHNRGVILDNVEIDAYVDIASKTVTKITHLPISSLKQEQAIC